MVQYLSIPFFNYYLDVVRLSARLFATEKRSPLFLILGAMVRVCEIARFCSPLPTPGDLGRVLKHLSATHNQTLRTQRAGASTPVLNASCAVLSAASLASPCKHIIPRKTAFVNTFCKIFFYDLDVLRLNSATPWDCPRVRLIQYYIQFTPRQYQPVLTFRFGIGIFYGKPPLNQIIFCFTSFLYLHYITDKGNCQPLFFTCIYTAENESGTNTLPSKNTHIIGYYFPHFGTEFVNASE